ncbi:succinate dehydrogenase/fumarate reductase iron-sulfur subunit [Chryseobacterium nematophagum]|uniref:Succinate dehydrogenase/fumarate reductase iron-sulfur subunit n=1 Tax=Chryseobacterium nematophagum TaxID=2305228 RepID=A0A3M7L9G3_9FLAO|nr:succinate dehydrogenase/fumarate reductase iron-sulfur subunit [Chryseobacterium nematophagum]RMZ59398.1 succinate dehydrogenase/fumarate reductase iron-sulfur subunit [Chryseobacterium nematophagum]
MNLHLKIWRQKDRQSEGKLYNYSLKDLNPHMSFLEMLDILNEQLILEGNEPVEFDHDCREGICGQCGMMINGIAHGPLEHTTTCQLHLRSFKNGETIIIEPFRAAAFPIKKDLKVDRSALDRIISSGGFVSVNTGQAPDATSIAVTHQTAEEAFDSAACIGCGACIATCKNGSAALFTSAKISHMALLPQGKEERNQRVLNMVKQMDSEHFGHCSNTEACEIECPQGISVLNIARMNYEYNRALFFRKK